MVSDQFLNKLQELWDAVMLDWPHWFDEDDNVYRLVRSFTRYHPWWPFTISGVVHAKNL